MNSSTNFHSRALLAILTLSLLCCIAVQSAWGNDDLFSAPQPLAPELAFTPSVTNVSPGVISIEYHIEKGYYLYRDKLSFSIQPDQSAQQSETSKVALGMPVYEKATIISDDFFGEQAIFRDRTIISLPYQSDLTTTVTLDIGYQGCADIGLCYPPNIFSLQVDLPRAERQLGPESVLRNVAQQSDIVEPNSSLIAQSGQQSFAQSISSGGLNNEILPPELAYLPQVVQAHQDAIEVRWFIEEGYYLYRDKISFEFEQADGLSVQSAFISPGVEQTDEFFGDVFVLRHSPQARILLAATDNTPLTGQLPANGQLIIHYQGCADIGICFPPSTATLPVAFSASSISTVANDLVPMAAVKRQPAASANAPVQSEQDRLTSLLANASIWFTVATFFTLGLLLAFTPCVLPMVPILSSVIVGQKQTVSASKAFQLSAVYVLVMASTYALVGIAVGLSGYNIQAFLQHPAVLTGMAILFVLLAMSMFGLYELQMPTSIQNKLTEWSNRQGGGQIGGVAAMGFISTLIVGPCVTAPLAGALLYIAKTGDALVGGAALFALGLGMGAPLLLIGTSAGKLLPRAGAWMDTIKQLFGVSMLAMAVYMLSRFLPSAATMTLYALLAIFSGFLLGAFQRLDKNKTGQMIGKACGLAVSLYGVALLLGAMGGGNSYLQPLSPFTSAGKQSTGSGNTVAAQHALPFQSVKSVAQLNEIVATAKEQNKPVMLDFYADWCISCKEMEKFTFTDERVQHQLSEAIVLQADVTANDKLDQALLKHFELFGPPGIIFYDVNGAELRPARVVGFMNADKFSAQIEQFLGKPPS